MVEITLLEVDLADAKFNAPFSRGSGGEPMQGLRSAVSEVTRSAGAGSEETELDLDVTEFEGDSPGRGITMVGAFLVLVALGWLVRRSRRRSSTGEIVPEQT